ncbi:hypothetical protein TNCV_3438411 [Trichonephila clavipes]|nr:hypothetical protein TNCV_3438411 [Trichonephila clavipes]
MSTKSYEGQKDRYLFIIERRNRNSTDSELFLSCMRPQEPDFQGGTVVPDFMTTMNNNARPHIAYLVDEFLESEDIRRMGLTSQISRSQPYTACLGCYEEATTTHQISSENQQISK